MSNRIVPAAWLPNPFPKQKPSRIVLHWTGGAYKCSDLDRAHYHIIIDGDCDLHRGDHSIKANCRPMLGGYAAHAKDFNAGTIGISICGMAGATEVPFKPGPFPIRRAQWEVAAQVVAECCDRYGIDPLTRAVCQHGEIQEMWGVKQRGKWDVCRLAFEPMWTKKQVGREFRMLVSEKLKALQAS